MTHLDELISLVKHPAIQKHRGEWREGDRFAINGEIWTICDYVMKGNGLVGTNGRGVYYYWDDMMQCTWLPPLSDPIHPGRSLFGILGQGKRLTEYGDDNGESLWICTTNGTMSNEYHGPTPEIAVAKAAIAQSEEGK